MIARSYEEAKRGLLNGEFVGGDRAIGKTTALVDVIAEKHNGEAVLVCASEGNADWLRKLYSERHPGKKMPKVITQHNHHGHRGYTAVYADLWSHFLEPSKFAFSQYLTAAVL